MTRRAARKPLAALCVLPLVAALSACSATGDNLAAGGTKTVAAAVPENPTQTAAALQGPRSFGASTQIPAIVNGEPITKMQVTRRAAFRKLRREKNTSRAAARDELIDDALKLQAAKRIGVKVPPERINVAYAGFAKSNRMSLGQLNQIMNQSGVTPQGFKDFIHVQIAWSSVVAQRGARGAKPLSEREAVARMLEQGGSKPTATEYFLQQVIFIVPKAKRSNASIAARRREAEAMRQRFKSCDATYGFAKGLKDVTVRDLGRKVGPELPPDWKDLIVGTQPGQATKLRTTDRGVEFVGVCRAREVSDDRTAQLVFANQDRADAQDGRGKKFLEALRKQAKIETR